VESIENKGSTFSLKIPVQIINIVEKMPEIIDIERETKPEKNYKILIAEDDTANFTYAKIALSKTNNQILHASNGAEAIEICRTIKDIDMILMDIKMPVIDGFTATIEIRKFNKSIPIIALTAFVQLFDRVKAIKSGCNDYLSKPVKKDELLKLIDTYLSNKPSYGNSGNGSQ
jgi:CheY-like chemotaxis protein